MLGKESDLFHRNECSQVNCAPFRIEPCSVYLHHLGFMCYRTLDNGEVDFCADVLKQSCNNTDGNDTRSIENIGPQEEGECANDHVV